MGTEALPLPLSRHALVALRRLERSDQQAWYGYLSQPGVLEHTSWRLSCLADLAANFDTYELPDPAAPQRFAIVLRDSGQLVGSIGLNTLCMTHRTADIAYDLAPAIWAQGVATAMVEAVVQWAMSELGLVRIAATVLDTNTRSQRVLERCGFHREGLMRSYRQVKGEPRDFWLYGRIAADA